MTAADVIGDKGDLDGVSLAVAIGGVGGCAAVCDFEREGGVGGFGFGRGKGDGLVEGVEVEAVSEAAADVERVGCGCGDHCWCCGCTFGD